MEQRVDPKVANDTFELDRCIECGICVAFLWNNANETKLCWTSWIK